MDTVSYLTINDETKEIADLVSRNTIEDIATILEAQNDNIGQMQLNIGSNGTLMASIREIRALAQEAHTEAAAAEALAELIEERMSSFTQTVEDIQTQTDAIEQSTDNALDQIQNTLSSIETSNQQLASIASSISTTQLGIDEANETADAALDKANEAITATEEIDQKVDTLSDIINAIQTNINLNNLDVDDTSVQLHTLESIVDVIDWFIRHSSISTDTEVNQNKNYYTYNSINNTISKINPIGTENPSEQNWYELNETFEDYITSNITEINNKISALPVSSRWQILISTDDYNNTEGMFVVDSNNIIQQIWTKDGISFNSSTPLSIGDENAYIVFDGNNHLTIGGSGVNIGDEVTIGENHQTLLEVIDNLDLPPAITIRYGLGNSNIDYSDVTEWLTEIPDEEEDKYIWMRIFDGNNYNHLCIQGTVGPRGETGPQGATGTGIIAVAISYAINDSELEIPSTNQWVGSLYELASIGSLNIANTDSYNNSYLEGNGGNDELEEEEIGETGSGDLDGSFLTILASFQQGKWLWIRTITEYSNGASTTTYQKSYIAKDGDNAVVNIIPTNIDWIQNTATLTVQLRANGTPTTPTSYYWTKGTSSTPIGVNSTLDITDLSGTYNCTVEWE